MAKSKKQGEPKKAKPAEERAEEVLQEAVDEEAKEKAEFKPETHHPMGEERAKRAREAREALGGKRRRRS